jgi:hypothetical protein
MTKKCAFCSHPADDHDRLAEVRLRMPGRMRQRHEHLAARRRSRSRT